ncbi:MAG TPA: 5'-3' exonuclease H3TH domain-containing protein [Candidatus Parcubacteria bacterium]|jgi:DNA polymerase-1|nr:5'-3' exonuclease H3TH domain-containing protein [Candidatus Parcubacteria bacterium]
MEEDKKKLIIIDSNAIIHRAFHALPPLSTKNGEVVNAVYGFLLIFFKAIKEFQPDFIVACFDVPRPTFRHKKYKEYKAKRPPAPKELYQQIPKIKEILKLFDVPVFEKEGYEADDLIGTISHLAPKKQVLPEIETIILTGDLDALQLIDSYTKVYTSRKGIKDTVLYDKAAVKERYGISPRQLLDYKSLRGDPSDNIPGVTGVGEKTASNLINKFGTLENLYKELKENSDKTKELPPRLRETLLKYKEQAFLSKSLVEIKTDVPIDFNLEKSRWGKYSKDKVIKSLEGLGFYSLIKRLPGNENKPESSNLKIC